MDTIEKILLNKFFPWFLEIAQMLGVLVIVYFIAEYVSSFYGGDIATLFFGILLVGSLAYLLLRMRRTNGRIKKLIESEAANIALAGNAQSGSSHEALAVIERRMYHTLTREGLAPEEKERSSRRISKKISSALLNKFNHLKGMHS